jgi:hypothetical protein
MSGAKENKRGVMLSAPLRKGVLMLVEVVSVYYNTLGESDAEISEKFYQFIKEFGDPIAVTCEAGDDSDPDMPTTEEMSARIDWLREATDEQNG